ncbi:dimethyl sulfoxide reductase subunit B [Gordonibacter sp. An230]|uniref:4Fe-4S dicluster domain-containing protein n=1 Tax=Gordonibacter sp. An230 TaxID=1965592 RepID=UPI000B3676D8|nr:4Fe-4S dicluster domain-containing protein [Gordonibacter sp. An230]OUO87597.1 dimethyl sulfoxide reductase subunit B [Gordonibacter sp. An230]
MTQYAFYFDGTRCTGCKTCEFACKDYYDLNTEFQYRKVYECSGGTTEKNSDGHIETSCFAYYVSMSCNHCDSPACVEVCPTGAMHKDAETGLVSVDADKCVGCGYCHMACPYNAPKVDREKGHSVKCDGCAERMASGERPICVRACPARALDFGTVEEMSKLGERGNIAPLPEPSYTNPNLYIKPSADALPAGHEDGKVANPLEVM